MKFRMDESGDVIAVPPVPKPPTQTWVIATVYDNEMQVAAASTEHHAHRVLLEMYRETITNPQSGHDDAVNMIAKLEGLLNGKSYSDLRFLLNDILVECPMVKAPFAFSVSACDVF